MKDLRSWIPYCFTLILLLATICAQSSPRLNGSVRVVGLPPGSSVTNLTICNNQLPFLWNGITCLVAGTYSATLITSTGSDSTALLNLSVINVGTSITNAVVCTNDLPFSWNGQTYGAGGTYSVTLTSNTGCDSVPILSLTVNDVVTSVSNVSVCSNQLPFSWNGNSYNSNGSYTVTLTSAAGCDSIATLNFSIKPTSASNTSVSLCLNDLPYNWNGFSFASAGIYPVTLVASNGCDSIATLDLNVKPLSSSLTAATVCNNDVPFQWNGNNYSSSGTYSANLSGANGCDSIATLNLTVLPVRTSITYVTVCTGQLPYSWNGNSYNAAGLFNVTLTASNGCDSVATLRLITTAFYSSSISAFTCSSSLPYTWNGVNYSSAGTYTANFVTAAGCDSIVTLTLSVQTPTVGTDSVIICMEQLPFNWHGLTFNAPGTYPIDPNVIIDACNTVDTLVLIVRIVVPGTSVVSICSNQLPYLWNGNAYTLTGIYGANLQSSTGCDSLASLNLTVLPAPQNIISLNTCVNQLPLSWNGLSLVASGTYTATIPGSNGCDSIVTVNLTVHPVPSGITTLSICNSQTPFLWNGNFYSTTGSYQATLVSSNGCDSIATLNLNVQGFLSSTTNLNLCSNQLPYSWNGSSYNISGTYNATLSNPNGCDSIATLILNVNDVITSLTPVSICPNQLPYLWNGNSYNTTGSYAVTLITAGGCDSVATLDLTVNGTSIDTVTIEICNNQLPFTWNGNSYPLAGVYPVTLTASTGCDSLVTLTLLVTDILTSTTNVTVCTAMLPFTWNGNNYNSGGTYSVTLSNPGGCDSVPILSLTIAPYVESTTAVSICSTQLPYTWNNTVFNSAGNFPVLLTGMSVCDSLATLQLSVTATVTSTSTITVCEQSLPYIWNGNSYDTAGSYDITLTAGSGCDSIATLVLNIAYPTSSNTVVNICESQLPFLWNGNSYNSSGVYSVTLIGSQGCDSTATLDLSANPLVTGSDTINICSSQLPFTWNGNVYATAGDYNVNLVSSAGCDSIAKLHLTATATITTSTAMSVCDNQFPVQWSGNTYTAPGTYVLSLISSGGCDSVSTLILTSNATSGSVDTANVCFASLPFSWNGNDYLSSGSFIDTLVNEAGCDSVATLMLTVFAGSSSVVQVTTCGNQLPYAWNGNNYPVAGNYQITLSNQAGCDSMLNLELIVNPVQTSITPINICASELPFLWNGNSYNSAGTYNVTLTAANGCDSIATLQLTAMTAATSTTVVDICEDQLPFQWNGTAYDSSGLYTFSLMTQSGCDSIAQLHLNINPVITTIDQVSICRSQAPYSWNGQSYSASGSYTASFTSVAGCDSIATLQLQVNDPVSSLINAATCANELPYSWNGAALNSTGIYIDTLVSSSGCDSIATLQLQVHPIPTSITVITVCSASVPYVWNAASFTTSGFYQVTMTSAQGCDSIATLNLTVKPTPGAVLAGPSATYCQYDETVALTASLTGNANQILWFDSPTATPGSTTAPIPSSAQPGVFTYYVSQLDGDCEGPRSLITVTVNRKPDLGPDKELRICYGQSANIGSLFDNSNVSTSWTYNDLPLTSLNQVTANGIYQVIATGDVGGCIDTAMVTLATQPLINANAGADADAETNVPYQLAGSGGVSYQWSPSQPLNNSTTANPLATLSHDQQFILMASDEIGCFDLDTVFLRVLDGPTFYVPSAFTPNSDGLNDLFMPTPVGIASLEFFRVFNRLGELVYETSQIGKGWDGFYKGKKQNIGNYVWSLKGTDRHGALKIMKGNVVLLR